MSAFTDLVAWLRLTNLNEIEPLEAEGLLNDVLRELTSGRSEKHREALFLVHMILTQVKSGHDPRPGLKLLASRYAQPSEVDDQPYGVKLEQRFREFAASLAPENWAVGAYAVLHQDLSDFAEEEPERILSTVQELDAVLSGAWEPYAETPITEDEMTCESVLAHRLLKEGFDLWFQALDEVELALEQGHEFDRSLELAEDGNRLLVALQREGSI